MKKPSTILTKPRFQIIATLLAAAIVAVVVAVGLQQPLPAKTGDIYLTEKSATVKKDGDVSFTLRITPGTAIDTVTATLSYDKSLLQYVKATYTDSPFGSQIPAAARDDSVTIQAAKLGGQTVDSDAFIATISFKGLKDGTARPTLTAGNAARAGEATHPTLAGKIVEASDSASGSGASSTDGTGKSTTINNDNREGIAPMITRPVEHLLQAAGVDVVTARRMAPWIVGVILAALLAGIVLVVLWYRKHRTSLVATKAKRK